MYEIRGSSCAFYYNTQRLLLNATECREEEVHEDGRRHCHSRHYHTGRGPPYPPSKQRPPPNLGYLPARLNGTNDASVLPQDLPHSPLQFTSAYPEATNMSRLSSLHPGLAGILPLADAMWKRARQPHEKFYGHSYTAPTPSTFFLQQFGLACTKAFAIHLRRKPSNAPRPHPSPPGPNRTPPGLSNPYSTTPPGI